MPYLPAAFMSYVQFDDQHDQHFLTKFRAHLSDEVRMVSGQEFQIFQDKYSIKWGEIWERRVDEALDAVTFLIPIMTPSFFRSPACRQEVERFLRREENLMRHDLVLPLYYVEAEELEDPSLRENDPVARSLYRHQYEDWRPLRGLPIERQAVKRRITSLAERIACSFVGNLTDEHGPAPKQDLQRDIGPGQHGTSAALFEESQTPTVPATGGDAEHPHETTEMAAYRERPRRSKKVRHKDLAAIWIELAAELQQSTFTPMDRTILIVRTKDIRRVLAQHFPLHPTRPGEVSQVTEALARALKSAMAPSVTATEMASQCDLAERLRKLLMGLITE